MKRIVLIGDLVFYALVSLVFVWGCVHETKGVEL